MTEHDPTTTPGALWYERQVRELGESQERNAAAHRAIAVGHRALAASHIAVAEQHEALAVEVPRGDQAAVDLAASVVAHDLSNYAGALLGTQALGDRTDAAQRADHARLERLEAMLTQVLDLLAQAPCATCPARQGGV